MKVRISFIIAILVLSVASVAFSAGPKRSLVEYYIQQGSYFTFSHINNTIADTNSSLILLQTGERHVHFLASISAGGQTEITISDDVNASSNGNELDLRNHFISSDKTSYTSVYSNPEINSVNSTIVKNLVTGSTSKKSVMGSTSTQREEYIFSKNSTYLINATNTSGGPIDINIRGSFYEMNVNH